MTGWALDRERTFLVLADPWSLEGPRGKLVGCLGVWLEDAERRGA